jgi:hypothetical protein
MPTRTTQPEATLELNNVRDSQTTRNIGLWAV